MASTQAVRLLEAIYARIDKQVREIVASMLPPITIAAQDDAVVIANDHRILNFQGPGVVVSDDPARRRANVFIPGAPTSSSSATFVSSTSAKAMSLWNGTSNNAPPTGWQTVGYDDSAWAAAVVATEAAGFPSISGASPIWRTTTPANDAEQALTRYTFTLAVTSITTATLEIQADNRLISVWINGTSISINPSSGLAQTIMISPALLVASGSNLLAVHGQNTL
jgi:hypothetical protein